MDLQLKYFREALPVIISNLWQHNYLKNDSRLFQQVSPHVGSNDLEGSVEIDLDVFAESRRVVVPCRFRISDGLHNWRWREDSFLDLSLGLRRSADGGEVSHRVLRAHSFASAGLAGNDNRLVPIITENKF